MVIFSCCIYPGSGITARYDETYEIFVQMIKGEFSIPVTEQTAKINSARVRFWRNKDNLSLRGGVLCFKGKAIAKKSALEKVVKKSFKTSKGSGTRKLYHRLKDSVASQNRMYTRCCRNQPFTRNSMHVFKIDQGFVRYPHEIFRCDIKSI